MTRHTGEGHPDLLSALRTGADPRAALTRSELAGCPACVEMVELEGRLAGLGAEERRTVDAARAELPPAGRAESALRERVLADTARANISGARTRRPGRRRALLGLGLGVAAAAAAALLFLARDREPVTDVKLGPELELLEPSGAVAGFEVFRWSAVPGAAWYRVVVEPLDDARPAGGARPASESGRLTDTTWRPTTEEVERWGERIRWTLYAHRPTGAGDPIDSWQAFAERSSH